MLITAMRVENKKNIFIIFESLKGTDNLEDEGKDRMIMLRWILNKMAGSCDKDNEPLS